MHAIRVGGNWAWRDVVSITGPWGWRGSSTSNNYTAAAAHRCTSMQLNTWLTTLRGGEVPSKLLLLRWNNWILFISLFVLFVIFLRKTFYRIEAASLHLQFEWDTLTNAMICSYSFRCPHTYNLDTVTSLEHQPHRFLRLLHTQKLMVL